ncbi:hypothetical protein ACFV42_48070 [Streptomyces solisilvae]|uniref:hypothetical protein n=1 Tax=Streptomyces malaysiensis TaxID=92644 RepID=UPI0036C42F7D
MTQQEPDPQPGDDSGTSDLDFFTRFTGVTGTVTLTLQTGSGTFRGHARADLDPDDIGSGFARLTGSAARALNASAGEQFEELSTGLPRAPQQAAANAENQE